MFRSVSQAIAIHSRLWLVLGCAFVGCDESTTSSGPQMDGSFRFMDASPVVDEGTVDTSDATGAADGTISRDAESPSIDQGTTDARVVEPMDMTLSSDAAQNVDMEPIPMPDQGVVEPGPDCEELEWVDLNTESVQQDTRFVYDGEVRQDRFRGTCTTQGTRGADAVMRFRAPSTGPWRFDTVGSGVDTDLYVRDVCRDDESERACNSDVNLPAGMTHSRVVVDLRAGDYVFVVVDSYNGLSRNPFRITVQPHEALPQPMLESLRAIPMPEQEQLAIVVTGQSTGALPAMIHFVALGPEDEVRGRRRYVPVEDVDRVGENFAFVSVVDWSSQDLERMSRLRLQLVDHDGEESEWMNAVPAPLNIGEDLGGVCESVALPCPAGQVCAQHRCRSREMVAECPDDWEITRLAPDPFGRSLFLSDNEEAIALWEGSCGGGTATQVFRYTPASDGRVLVSVIADGEAAEPILYARALCAFENALHAEEMGCADSPTDEVVDPAGGQSSLILNVQEGVPAFLFVDSSGRGGVARWRGQFRIQVTAVVSPTIENAVLVRDAMGGRLSVYFETVDIDFSDAALRLLDNNGDPIEFAENSFDWPLTIQSQDRENALHRVYALLDAPGNLRLRAARRAELIVRDRLGLLSIPFPLEFSDGQERGLDESCDPQGLVHICSGDDLNCADMPWPRCVESPE